MRVRQKHALNIESLATVAFVHEFRLIVEELPRLKTACKPRFNKIFQRKMFCLLYLMDIEREIGKFSVRDIAFFFRHENKERMNAYFYQLIEEGWIVQINHSHRKSLYAVLSPLALECITMLRRRVEAANAETLPESKQMGKTSEFEVIDIPHPERPAIEPDNSGFDFFQDTPDLRK